MQVDINLAYRRIRVAKPELPPKGLKAVAGFVSSNACRRPGWLASPTDKSVTLVAIVAEARFPVPRLEIIAKLSHLTFQSNIEHVIPIGELFMSGTGV